MSVSVEVKGAKRVIDNMRRMGSRIANLNIAEFGYEAAGMAKAFLEEGKKHYPQHRPHMGIRFDVTGTGKNVKIEAWSDDGKGFDYSAAQEYGTGPRAAQLGKYMTFLGSDGNVVKKKFVGPIPGIHYMEKTKNWAQTRFKRYAKARVKRIIDSNGRDEGYGLTLTGFR